jgi:uncharacterized protein
VNQDIDEPLEKRLGRLHSRLRRGIEADHEAQVFGQGINYFHIENLRLSHVAIRFCLKLTGLYGRGLRNAAQIELRRHDVISSRIPKAFDGFKILHLSDLHVEMSEAAMMRLAAIFPNIEYDLCVLTGDYRAQTFGAFEPALAGMARLCSVLKRPIYAASGPRHALAPVRSPSQAPRLQISGALTLTVLRRSGSARLTARGDWFARTVATELAERAGLQCRFIR